MTCDICERSDCESEYGVGSPSCYRHGYERLRASLSTAEKALTEAREEAVEAGAHAIRSELLVDELRRDRDEWRTQHENLLAMYHAAISGGAHVDGPGHGDRAEKEGEG